MKLYQYSKKTDKEIQEECRKIFIGEYICRDDGSAVIIKTIDDFQVIFEKERFDHAFSRERKVELPREFDYSRARRVLWIKKLIKEKCEGLKVLKEDVPKINPKQRLYYLPDIKYLVVLDWMSNTQPHHLRFNTHYSVTMAWKLSEIEQIFNI